ncbi:Glycosyltransferase involved in cell wall bisynthesis [Paenibacillus polysaccharolyticus]|uniref:Glycosyltransferase involved in cell wall bisynthesis n=1 Tax=Paenibacillus polysaccharolyticus TaxID=582692 RepID=A0A1G5KCF7_9BACL|nr:glycosyltransferase family 2 protein [Paenibacillus polysaccharolyticus]SCY98114.1 Glycosyltransferase involved in cell wall bisynthesis [Paenibacillus polysaccharolyticus]
MQSKVSMIMPCYNKVKYIGEMFDSILAQEWDNIELILVNDGSTDGTRDVIAEYELKFRERGFEVVIEDQKNAGVCAAAKAGLSLATGDYVCMVDSDDELDPKYVSLMAGWLDENADYDYCICGGVHYTGSGIDKKFEPLNLNKINDEESYYTERYLLTDVRPTVWIYLLRMEYLRKCNIIENYFVNTKGSHEPGYVIPLTINNGKYKYFPLPLYHFNAADLGHSRYDTFEPQKQFYDDYYELCKIAIDRLPDDIADYERKEKLLNTALISRDINIHRCAKNLANGNQYLNQSLESFIKSVNDSGLIPYKLTTKIIEDFGFQVVSRFVSNYLINYVSERTDVLSSIRNNQGRLVGYGAGRVAKRILPDFMSYDLIPDEIWDIKAGLGELFYEVPLKQPDFDSLTEQDTIIMLMYSNKEVESRLDQTNVKVVYFQDVLDELVLERFSEQLVKQN